VRKGTYFFTALAFAQAFEERFNLRPDLSQLSAVRGRKVLQQLLAASGQPQVDLPPVSWIGFAAD
jgi:hypothetical protein